MRIRIGNVTTQVAGLESRTDKEWHDEFAAFATEDEPDLWIRYEGDASRGWPGAKVRRFQEVDAGKSRALIRGARWEAELGISSGQVEVRTAGDWPQQVRVLLSPAAQARAVWLGKAVPVHGAAFVVDGKAVALVGASGAGKTTCARYALARGCDVMAEDLVWIGIDGADKGSPAVHMLPFAEKSRLVEPWPHVVPLAAIFTVEQSREDAVVALDPADRLRAVWQRISVPLRFKQVTARAFRLGSYLEALVPVMGLRFTHSDAFVDVIADWLRSREARGPVESPPDSVESTGTRTTRRAALNDGEDA